MSGSLARLVLLAQGQLPVAEPLLPSRFAPVVPQGQATAVDPWPEIAADSEPTPAPSAPSHVQRAPAASGRTAAETGLSAPTGFGATPFAEHTSFGEKGVAADRTQAGHPASADLTVPFGIRETAVPIARLPDPAPTEAAMPRPQQGMRPEVHAAPPASATDRSAHAAAPVSAHAIAPDRSAHSVPPVTATDHAAEPIPAGRRPPVAFNLNPATTSAARPTPAASAPARAPDVHISIGRLEVHAGPARAAPARPAPPRRPQQSLADYLARRK
jgi:hypothetical protein